MSTEITKEQYEKSLKRFSYWPLTPPEEVTDALLRAESDPEIDALADQLLEATKVE